MKTLAFIITFLITSLISHAQEITVTVDHISNNNGKVIISLHNVETFMKGPCVLNSESNIEDGKVTVIFKDVKPGEYAIMVLHDENESNSMDYDENGMPIEAYGTSNNTFHYGPPKFIDAKFKLGKEDLKIKISL